MDFREGSGTISFAFLEDHFSKLWRKGNRTRWEVGPVRMLLH